MTKKYTTLLGGILLMAGPALAGRQTPEPIPQGMTRLEKLEAAVEYDQFVIENPTLGEKPVLADVRREAVKEKLAKDQAALDAFKTAGPDIARQEAIDYNKWVVATGGGESKFVQREARIKAARAELAKLGAR